MFNITGILLLLLATFSLLSAALLPNGDFEIAPSPNQLSGTKVEGKHAIPKWETSGFVEYIKSGTKQGDWVLVVPEGEHAVRLGHEGSIKQRVWLQKGRLYALSFSFARTCSKEEQLNISVTAKGKTRSGLLPLQTIYSSLGFDSYAYGFHADDNTVDITLHNPGEPSEDPACGPLIDTIALTILDPPRPTRYNLVKNGEFGEGPYMSHSAGWGVLIPPKTEDKFSPLPAWMIESYKAVKYIDSLHFFVPEGKRAVELVGGKESSIAQTIRTRPGWTYLLTFLVGDARNGCVGPLAIEATVGRQTTTVNYNSNGTGGFTKGSLVFKADNHKTRIRFLSTFYTMTATGSMCGPVLDDVKVVPFRYRPRSM